MRMINIGLTILATLALASSAFGAASGNTKSNTLAGTVGPGATALHRLPWAIFFRRVASA